MEENVALDTSKQKKFVKSIKGIKKLVKKAEVEKPETDVLKIKDGKKPKRKRPDRGLVYLSHIPHGFYESEMTEYFKQFGAVSNVRVIKSKRTGNSKGFAFVEFKQPAVAEIVAETMNNYLMGKRLIKAAYIPPEKQRPKAMRKHWSRLNNPGRTARLAQKKAYNQNKDNAGELAKARKTLSVFKKNMKKLSDLGINYDFFTPVDIPEALQEGTQKAIEAESNSKSKHTAVQKESKQNKKDQIKSENNKPVPEQKVEKKVDSKKKNKDKPVFDKKEQKQKEQKLKDAGVKPALNFIQLQDDSASDGSADFDSDDYTKALENDSDVESGESDVGESDEFEITGSDDDDSEVDESEEDQVIAPPKSKGKRVPVLPQPTKASVKPKRNEIAQRKEEQQVKQMVPVEQKGSKVPEQGKRKAAQKNAVSPKKPKFEKQTHQQLKKQFKKK